MTYRDYGALRAEDLGPFLDQPPHTYSFKALKNRVESWLETVDIQPGTAMVDPTNPEFGAVGDSTYDGTGTDDTAAFQAAIDALEAVGGGVLAVPPGSYLFSDPLTVTKPIRIIGAGHGIDNTEDDSLTAGLVTFVKKPGSDGGDVPTAMIAFGSATAANYLSGCGVENVKFILQSITGAIHLRRVQDSYFADINAQTMLGTWVDPDTGVGVITMTEGCRFNTFDRITLATTGNACCLFMDGDDATYPGCTQNVFRHMRVTYGDSSGDGREGGIIIQGQADNNRFHHTHCIPGDIPSVSQLYGVVIRDGATGSATGNLFNYLSAHVYVEDGCGGNRITAWTSEASSLTFETPSSPAPMDYVVQDYGHHRSYETQRYAMSDTLFVGASSFQPTGGSAFGTFGVASSIDFDTTAEEYAVATIPPPPRWGDGDITGCTVHWATTAGLEAETVTLRAEIATFALTEAATDKNSGADTDVVLGATPGTKLITTALTVTGVDYTEGDTIGVKITRVVGGADNATGDIHFLGVTLAFAADGPLTSGGGPFAIPARFA